MQTAVAVALLALNSDMLTNMAAGEVVFIVWVLLTGFATYIMYLKASFTDPGVIRAQIYLNQNTEESANYVARSKKHARKPSTMLQELEKDLPSDSANKAQSI